MSAEQVQGQGQGQEQELARESGSKRACVIVKLGGSAITEKDNFETVKQEVLDATAHHISTAVRESGLDVIVVHGAGSFGHFQAHEYGVSKGGLVDVEGISHWEKGFALTRESVTSLNKLVVHALLAPQHELSAVAVSLFPTGALCYRDA